MLQSLYIFCFSHFDSQTNGLFRNNDLGATAVTVILPKLDPWNEIFHDMNKDRKVLILLANTGGSAPDTSQVLPLTKLYPKKDLIVIGAQNMHYYYVVESYFLHMLLE